MACGWPLSLDYGFFFPLVGHSKPKKYHNERFLIGERPQREPSV
jgi:hypothetical protein